MTESVWGQNREGDEARARRNAAAVERVRLGEKVTDVAASIGVSDASVYAWVRRDRIARGELAPASRNVRMPARSAPATPQNVDAIVRVLVDTFDRILARIEGERDEATGRAAAEAALADRLAEALGGVGSATQALAAWATAREST